MSKVALITGGAQRIGKEIALFLFNKHYKIALHYNKSKEAAEEVAEYINKNGGECFLFPLDLTDIASAARLIPEVINTFQSCELLINNASLFKRAYFNETDESCFDQQFNVNFKGPFFLSQHFANHCGKGHIVNLLDTKVSRNHTPYFVYSLTKKMLLEFTKMAAVELGPEIRVNGICPGLILPPAGSREESFKKMGEKIPLKSVGKPRYITSAVGYLIENPYVTGECLFVDGGESLI